MAAAGEWAKCRTCGGEVWFDAWVTYDGTPTESFDNNPYCPTCDGQAFYEVVTGDKP